MHSAPATMATDDSSSGTMLVVARVSGPGVAFFEKQVGRDLTSEPPEEAIDVADYSFGYTGRHDGGHLPPARRDNEYGHVISALLESKTHTDNFLRSLLPAAAAEPAVRAPHVSAPPTAKKRRIGSGSTAAFADAGGARGDVPHLHEAEASVAAHAGGSGDSDACASGVRGGGEGDAGSGEGDAGSGEGDAGSGDDGGGDDGGGDAMDDSDLVTGPTLAAGGAGSGSGAALAPAPGRSGAGGPAL
jgi:hypothetical protein